MNTEKLQEQNITEAAAAVSKIEKKVGKTQKALRANKDEYKRLIAEAQTLVDELAEAKEYLADLVEAKTD